MTFSLRSFSLIVAFVVSGISSTAVNALQDPPPANSNAAAGGEGPTTSKELQLNEHLSVFTSLIGKTFRGEFAGSTPDKPIIDVSTYERAMNGQAVRSLHSINQGEYGGESIFMWDEKQQKISFWYFTTAGFFTQGTLEVDGNQLTSIEEVTGNANGITKVKGVSTILENGELQVKSEYFANGVWSEGRNTLYKPVSDAKVIFK